MSLEDEKRLYAQLVVQKGVNVQPGQLVNIRAEIVHREIVMLLAEAAYERGASYVSVQYEDPQLSKMRIDCSVSQVVKHCCSTAVVECSCESCSCRGCQSYL